MAQGTIRIRCKVCRKAGAPEKECKTHPERVFNALYPTPSGKQDTGTFSNQKEADLFIAEARLKYHKNPNYLKPAAITFNKYVDIWLEERKNSTAVQTYSNYECIIRIYIRPIIGEMPMNSITPEMISDIRNRVRASQKSVETINRVRLFLKSIFRDAVNDGVCNHNPCTKLKREKINKTKDFQILSPEQIKSFLEVSPEPRRTYYAVALLTGMRSNEICGLKWKDVDLTKNKIQVNKTIYHFANSRERAGNKMNWVIQPAKTRTSNRTIPMSPMLKKALEIHKINNISGAEDFVFGGKLPAYHKGIRDCMIRDLQKADCPHIRFHDLRHVFASYLIAQNLNPKAIQVIMGHSTINTTMDVYGHLFPSANDDIAINLDKQIFGLPEPVVSLPCHD